MKSRTEQSEQLSKETNQVKVRQLDNQESQINKIRLVGNRQLRTLSNAGKGQGVNEVYQTHKLKQASK